MKDSYSFDVDDAGLERVLPGPPRGLHPDLRPARLRLRHRLGDVRRHGRLEVRGVPRQGRRRRGHLRPLHELRLRRQRRGRPGAGAARPCRTTTCRPRTPRTRPDTPTIETLVDHLNAAFPRDDRPWTAADTLKNVLVMLSHPDGTREPLAIGVPGDREVDLEAARGASRAGRGRAVRTRTDFADAPDAGQGLHRPGRAGGEERLRDPLPRRPARRRGHPLGDRRRRGRLPRDRPRRRPRLHAPTARSRRPRSATATPARTAATASLETARGIEMGHIFQLGRKYAEALGPPGARRERQAGHRHHGLLRHRPLAGRRRDRGEHPRRASACAGRARSRPPTSTWSRPARTARSSRPPPGSPTSSSAAGVDVLYDDRAGKVSPGVKFKDAELIGVPTIVTVGRGLADGTIEVRDRAHRRAAGGPGRRGGRAHRAAVVPWLKRSRPSSSTGAARSPAGTTSTSTRSRWRSRQAVVDADHDRTRSSTRGCWRRVAWCGAAAATTSRARPSPTCSPRPVSSTTPTCWRRTTSSGSPTPRPTPRCGRCGRS